MAIKYSGEGVRDTDGNILVGVENGQVTGACAVGGRRNLIINGAMQVAQRGTQVTGKTSSGYYTADRFESVIGTLGTWTVDQSTDAPSGFSNSLKMTCTTADASPAAGDYLGIYHHIEAQNLQHLAFGTSDAKALTLSFWVKSNKTGNATVDVTQVDNSSKHISPSYTINAADTWEYKTISVPADTSGLINNDNGDGLRVDFWLNSGSNWSSGTNQTTWSSNDNTNRNPSNLGVGGATSDYFAITGVQLEVGSVATPFEHRSYGEELALCQRYYQYHSTPNNYGRTNTSNDNYRSWVFMMPVAMRTSPSVTSSGGNATVTWNGMSTTYGWGEQNIGNTTSGLYFTSLILDSEL